MLSAWHQRNTFPTLSKWAQRKNVNSLAPYNYMRPPVERLDLPKCSPESAESASWSLISHSLFEKESTVAESGG